MATGVGYTGGEAPHPTYRQVCAGGTGHAEAVQVEFDPSVVSYRSLLESFFAANDPTRERAGSKSQYRMAVFTYGAEQARIAREVARDLSERTGRPVTIPIEPAGAFHLAEEYHQRYFEKSRGFGACGLG